MLFTIFIKSKNLKKGTISAIYLILYALVRLFVENIRLDSVLNIANLHIASIICVFAIILSASSMSMFGFIIDNNSYFFNFLLLNS